MAVVLTKQLLRKFDILFFCFWRKHGKQLYSIFFSFLNFEKLIDIFFFKLLKIMFIQKLFECIWKTMPMIPQFSIGGFGSAIEASGFVIVHGF